MSDGPEKNIRKHTYPLPSWTNRLSILRNGRRDAEHKGFRLGSSRFEGHFFQSKLRYLNLNKYYYKNSVLVHIRIAYTPRALSLSVPDAIMFLPIAFPE